MALTVASLAEAGPSAEAALRGLTATEVAQRQAAGATNAFRPATSRTYRQILRDNLVNPFNLTLAVLISILIVLGQPGDSIFSAFAVVTNTTIAVVQEVRAKRQMDALARLAERRATVVRDGAQQTVSEPEVVRDDVVAIGPGDRVPVDGPVVEADALEVSESLISGESDPIAKAAGDRLTSGSYVTAGRGLMRAEQVGAESFVNSLGMLASRLKVQRTPLQQRIDAIVWISVLVMCLFAPLHVVASIKTSTPLVDLVRSTIALVTTFVPQGVVLATTVALTFGAVRISRRRTLVQRLNAIESMGNVTVLCFDKTGTLTENQLHVVDLVPLGGRSVDELRTALAAHVGLVATSNATSDAIAAAVGRAADRAKTGEVGFSSARKWGAVLYADDSASILGAPEFLLHGTERERAAELAASGHRVIALATASGEATAGVRAGVLAERLRPIGLAVLQDRPRADVRETLQAFTDRGIGLKVISGDSLETVCAIAAQAGIPVAGAVGGPELAAMDDAAFGEAVRRASVFARITPDLKRRIVKRLQAAGEYVAMVGDGVNDVPALKAAQLGIAMDAGAQMAKEVAELVLLDNSLATLPRALEEGRITIEKAYATCRIFLSKNFYMVLMFILVGYANLPFPGQVRELSWATFITAAVPTTLIAFGLIKPKPIRLFVHNVIGYILVAGTFGAVLLTVAYLFAYLVSGQNVDLSRSFLIVIASTYGVLVFWDTCGLVPTRLQTLRRQPTLTALGLVIGVVAVFTPQLAPSLFKATSLPPLYWLAYVVAMIPVLFLFRRLVVERKALVQPLRSLFQER